MAKISLFRIKLFYPKLIIEDYQIKSVVLLIIFVFEFASYPKSI